MPRHLPWKRYCNKLLIVDINAEVVVWFEVHVNKRYLHMDIPPVSSFCEIVLIPSVSTATRHPVYYTRETTAATAD